jgi:preprotein translocase subunit SecF
MDIVRDTKIDWLKYKWAFIGVSLILMLAGTVSLFVTGLNLGVDFTGGTLVYVKFADTPQLDRIRSTLSAADLGAEGVTLFDDPSKNEVQIRLGRLETDEAGSLGKQSESVARTLREEFDSEQSQDGKLDLNSVSRGDLEGRLSALDPDNKKQASSVTESSDHYRQVADQIISLRTDAGGILGSMDQFAGLGLSESMKAALAEHAYFGSFTLISVESVGPKVGMELQTRARMAVFWSLVGMLIYIAFRFRPIYGIAAIVALFHDVFITIGFFSISQKEISLTVIAALLTLVGYSINDSIVVFDRVRENLRMKRRDDFASIINASINQTLNRTILTSGMTFLAVFSLYLLGGQVLNGFSFALVIGIIVGTYSSIAIASPIVLWWQMFTEKRRARV